MKNIQSLFITTIVILSFSNMLWSCTKSDDGNTLQNEIKPLDLNILIPTTANSWVYNNPDQTGTVITDEGITNWSDADDRIRTFFRLEQIGDLDLGIKAKVNSGQAKIKCTFNGISKEITISNTSFQNIEIGTFKIEQKGYYFLEMQGIQSSADFPEVSNVCIGNTASLGKIYYVKDDFYWGRRGPSVHLNYEIPAGTGDALYFYNEITIPEGNDVLGSYFMANGFGQGYFGIQVNSETERRVLFSVWSPYNTDNPNSIPEEYRIKMIKKGENVYTGEFGNEGAGGQSYLKYYWKTGNTYRFLLKGQPVENNSTDFTAWFYAPESGDWKLIASFRRPMTTTYLKSLYSFLENFMTETGETCRKGLYSNQWVYTTTNNWVELSKIKFTADATARKENRLDYAGGLENGKFFLKNCGFFSDKTTIDSWFERPKLGMAPVIDFTKLP